MQNIYNRNLFLVVGLVSAAVIIRTFIAAQETHNWPGFWFTTLQVLAVGSAAAFVLKK